MWVFPKWNHEFIILVNQFQWITWIRHLKSLFHWYGLESSPEKKNEVYERFFTRAPILLLSILMSYSLQCIEQMSIVEPAQLLTVCAHTKYIIFHNTKCSLLTLNKKKHITNTQNKCWFFSFCIETKADWDRTQISNTNKSEKKNMPNTAIERLLSLWVW